MGEDSYQEVFGVKKRPFEEILKVLEAEYEQKHKKVGCLSKLRVGNELIIMLQHYREYRSMWYIAFDYGVVKSTISDAVSRTEQTLIRNGLFRLPLKRKLLEADSSVEVSRRNEM